MKRARIIVLISESAEEHIEAEHAVTFPEVLEAADNRGLLFPTRWGRSALLGVTDAGRLLRVVLEPDERGANPKSGRPLPERNACFCQSP